MNKHECYLASCCYAWKHHHPERSISRSSCISQPIMHPEEGLASTRATEQPFLQTTKDSFALAGV
jgi:hypothetical protein